MNAVMNILIFVIIVNALMNFIKRMDYTYSVILVFSFISQHTAQHSQNLSLTLVRASFFLPVCVSIIFHSKLRDNGNKTFYLPLCRYHHMLARELEA